MADNNNIVVELGRVPKERGVFNPSASPLAKYYKDNIVEYQGSAFIAEPTASINDGNSGTQDNPEYYLTRVPFTTDPATPNSGWRVFANGRHRFSTGEEIGDVGIDAAPTENSNNLVKSGGVYTQLSQLDQDVNGLPEVVIDLSDYDLTNGTIQSNTFYDVGNYGLYHRCKIVPISLYKGRTIRVTPGVSASYSQFIATVLKDNVSSGTAVVYATGYSSVVTYEGVTDLHIPNDGNYLYFYITDTRTENNYEPSSVRVLSVSSLFYTRQETDEITSSLEGEISDLEETTSIEIGRIKYSGSLGATVGVTYILPISSYENVGKKFRIKVNSNNYSSIGYSVVYTDDTQSLYNNATGNDVLYVTEKNIAQIGIYVRANQSAQSYNIELYAGGVVGQAYTIEGRVDTIEEQVESLEEQIEQVVEVVPVATPVELTIHTVEGVNGYWKADYGSWTSDNTRKGTEKISVIPGEKYLVTTKIGASTAIAYLAQYNGATFKGVATGFTGGSGDAVDKEYTVPNDVNTIAICSYDTTNPTLKKVVDTPISKSYTKTESDAKYEEKENTISKYGVKWSLTDFNDLGQRCFASVGKTATIGIGNTNGSSDFDSIYPWSEMKRCNIKKNANGARIVTFEGDTGFSLDGTNGDVFVRIPKFKTNHYIENGEEYIIIGDGYTHPAFIEDGVELDEIFIGSFEASMVSNALYSKSGVIPANNYLGTEFLAAAKARGNNYTLADMRSVDAVWKLMAVEFGCRNSNRVLGYGYSDYWQPINSTDNKISIAVENTNIATLGVPPSNSYRLMYLTNLAPGNNITICDGTQDNIVAQRKVVSVTCATTSDNIVVEFDGSPLDLTTTMFVGNAACDTNYCESIGNVSSSYALSWHTGRANRPPQLGDMKAEMINPCRYRWIENPVGNIWQFLPDITFYNLQMYECKNMKDYVMFKHESPYLPIGPVLPVQSDNGTKNDINTDSHPNYWITSLLNDIFAKGNSVGKTFDTVHDGTITSQKGFGGYYYLYGAVDTPYVIINGGGFDHAYRSNMLTNRAWGTSTSKWFLYGARLMYKNLD